jgi:hypothetical protein
MTQPPIFGSADQPSALPVPSSVNGGRSRSRPCALGATTVTSTLLGTLRTGPPFTSRILRPGPRALRTETDVIPPTRRYLPAEGDGAYHDEELIPRFVPLADVCTATYYEDSAKQVRGFTANTVEPTATAFTVSRPPLPSRTSRPPPCPCP